MSCKLSAISGQPTRSPLTQANRWWRKAMKEFAVIVLVIAIVVCGSRSAQSSPKPAEIRTDKAKYPEGQKVKIDLIITNTTSETQEYTFSSGQQFDVWVSSGGKEVWRWSHGCGFIMMFTHLSLQPGESKTFSATWDQRDEQKKQVPAGSYTVSGQLTPTGDAPPAVSTRIDIRRD
jgi:hypothetical protein